MSHILVFALVGLVAVAVPGPDFAIVTRNALVNRRLGVYTAAGIAGGLAVHAALATAGLSAVLLTSATAFSVVKLLGVPYLGYLGVQALATALRSGERNGSEAPKGRFGFSKPQSPSAAARQGLLTNVLNPKAVFFFISLLPQFVPAGASVAPWTAAFAFTMVIIAFAWFSLVAVFVSFLRRALQRPRVSRTVEGITGLAFLGFGLRLAFERR